MAKQETVLTIGREEMDKLEMYEGISNKKIYVTTKNGLKDLDDSSVSGYINSRVFSKISKFIPKDHYSNLLSVTIYDKKVNNQIPKIDVYKRMGGLSKNKIYYDLCNEVNEVVEIDSAGWKIRSDNRNFIRTEKMMEQPTPELCDDRKILEKHFLHCSERDTLILLMVSIIARFIPDIEQPLLYYHGSMGAAKSTTAKKEKMIVDPTSTMLKVLPRTLQDTAISLNNEYLSVFDNVSQLNNDISDLLCMAVTGGTYSTRTLYTNADEVILDVKSAMSITGIDVCIKKPDLYDRTILIELKRIKESEYRMTDDVLEELKSDMPRILGYIFTILSKSMNLYSEITTKNSSRLSGFYRWGCCIAEVMGYGMSDFEKAYRRNKAVSNEKVLQESYLGDLIGAYMKNKSKVEMKSSELYAELKIIAISENNLDDFPKTANVFGKQLRELEVNLKNIGIEVEVKKTKNYKLVTITNENAETNDSNSVENGEFEDYI